MNFPRGTRAYGLLLCAFVLLSLSSYAEGTSEALTAHVALSDSPIYIRDLSSNPCDVEDLPSTYAFVRGDVVTALFLFSRVPCKFVIS